MREVRRIIAIVAVMKAVLTQVYLLPAAALRRHQVVLVRLLPRTVVRVLKGVMVIMSGNIQICWLHTTQGEVVKP